MSIVFSDEEGLAPPWMQPGGTTFGSARFRDWVYGRIYGRSRIDFPVGRPSVAVGAAGTGLPSVVPTTVVSTTSDIPDPIDRRDKPSNQEGVSLQTVSDWFDYHRLQSQGIPVQHISMAPPQATIVSNEDSSVGVLSDIYDVVDAGLGGVLPGGVPFGSSIPGQVFQTPQVPVATHTGTVIPAGTTAMPPMPAQCDPNGPKPVLKFHCGQWKWVFPKRRRRKQLVTQTDIKGLAALKGVVGVGKTMETWIATHS